MYGVDFVTHDIFEVELVTIIFQNDAASLFALLAEDGVEVIISSSSILVVFDEVCDFTSVHVIELVVFGNLFMGESVTASVA